MPHATTLPCLPYLRVCILGGGCASVPPGDSKVTRVESFRAAKSSGDLEHARTFLTDDPRVWYETRDGDGRPWTLGAGRWKAWDDHFRSSSTDGPWQVEDDRIWTVVDEVNDYYLLMERSAGRYVLTYFFDASGAIEGFMISDAPNWTAPPGRTDEFEAWAREHHPDELEYLRPGRRIDPTGDRAMRTRRLANRWRASVGLPRLE